MRLTKKGDLALSTNAIVVLIIAVIILGLIITFVTQGFGAVSDKFFGQINQLPNPESPSPTNPITTSEVLVAGAGQQFGMKISVLNTGTSPTASTFVPTVTCTDNVLSTATADIQVSGHIIQPGKFATFTYLGKIVSGAESKQHLCQVAADESGAGGTVVSQDVVIKVK